MSEEPPKPLDPDDAQIEREIRSRRKFSLAEAIGRAGGDLLKGASPVTRKRQAELQIEQFLERRLADSEGALRIVLLRRVSASERLVAAGYDQPLAVLAGVTGHLLESEERLEGFVRAVDAEWGRIYSERPHFELAGRPPDREDPYTRASVREALTRLLEALERAGDDDGPGASG